MLDIVRLRKTCRVFRDLPLHVARMDWPMVRACLRTDADKQTTRNILRRYPRFTYKGCYESAAERAFRRHTTVAMHGTLDQIICGLYQATLRCSFSYRERGPELSVFLDATVGNYHVDPTYYGTVLAFNTTEVALAVADRFKDDLDMTPHQLNYTFLAIVWRGDPALMRRAHESARASTFVRASDDNQQTFYKTLVHCARHSLLAGYGRVPYNWDMLDATLNALKHNKKLAELAVVTILTKISPLLDVDRAWRLFGVMQAYVLDCSIALGLASARNAFDAHIKHGAEDTLRRFWDHPLFGPHAARLLRHKTYKTPIGRIDPPNPKDPRVRDFKGALSHLDPLHRLGTAIFASPRPAAMARIVAELHPWGPAMVAHAITVAHICTGDRWTQNGLPPMTDERRRELCLEHVQRAMYPATE